MRFLFLFLDGVGIGPDDPDINPLARAHMPVLLRVLNGHKLVRNPSPDIHSERASLVYLDANLGVEGRPQSASGQAAILTGQNIPYRLGQHYGPKPNAEIRDTLRENNLFSTLSRAGLRVTFLNAYPEGYFQAIKRGKRLPGVFSFAFRDAGLRLKNTQDLIQGRAISADFTGAGWHEHLDLLEVPVITPQEAGEAIADLSEENDFSFFEYWLSDYAGHRKQMDTACQLLESFDQLLGSLLNNWDDDQGLILITSDHGNMEDLSTRRHTRNPVPAIVLGAPELRKPFISNLNDLSDLAPAITQFFRIRNQ